VSTFTRRAAQRVVDQARSVGVPVPPEVLVLTSLCGSLYAPQRYAADHPDLTGLPDGMLGCCWGAALDGPARCTCWEPVFDVEQAPAVEGATPTAAETLCGDCAFRPGSPERADGWLRETLYELADRGEPFWCHRGMRRPAYWQHPAGPTVPGSPDDWQPLTSDGTPYQADGQPALLCAGWARRAARGSTCAAT